ncbi:MAG: hypothetical protein HRT87_06040 [Legionellales bacterium]|nr:hypothetical protein [Legionellales bacterium]
MFSNGVGSQTSIKKLNHHLLNRPSRLNLVAKGILKPVDKMEELLSQYISNDLTLAEELDLAVEINELAKENFNKISIDSYKKDRYEGIIKYTQKNIEQIFDSNNQKIIDYFIYMRKRAKTVDPEYIPGKNVNLGVRIHPHFAPSRIIGKFRGIAKKALLVKRGQSSYVDIRYPRDGSDGALQLNEKQRAEYRVLAIDGKLQQRVSLQRFIRAADWLYNENHEVKSRYAIFSTKDMTAKGRTNNAAYTLNQYGELSIFNHWREPKLFFHCSMNSSAPVVAAGTLSIDSNGQITEITNNSGHYKPSRKQFMIGVEHLRQHGINMENVKFDIKKKKDIH